MNIRLADIQDIEGVVSIIEQYRCFYGVETQSREDIEKFVRLRITHSESKIFIAIDDAEIVGFIQLYPSFSTVSLKPQWILNDLFVAEQYRKKGVATALMNAVKEHFRGLAKGFILVTDKTNTAAQDFYKKCGWETGEYDFYTFFYKERF